MVVDRLIPPKEVDQGIKQENETRKVDENYLYGEFHKDVARRNKIHGMAIRKALNLPLEDDVKNVGNRVYNGVPGWVAALLMLLGMLGPLLGLLAWNTIGKKDVPPATKDTDTKYDLVPLPGE